MEWLLAAESRRKRQETMTETGSNQLHHAESYLKAIIKDIPH